MLKPPRKWGMPSAAEVQSIKERIHQMETKLAEETLQDHETDATIKELMLKKAYIAPIRKLPFEILSEIFILCSLSSQHSTPVRISAVCHRWRDTILATPLAWTCITPYIKGLQSRTPLLAYVTTFLQRSHRCLLRLDWSHHPSSCIRSHDSPQKSGNPWDPHCRCEIIERIAEHRDRIQYIHTGYYQMHAFVKMGLPNLERLAFTSYSLTSTLWLKKFPKLSYLDVGEHGRTFDVRQVPQTCLQYLSIHTDRHGVWSQLINHNGRTLKTLKLRILLSAPRDLQQNMDLDCLALERILIIDQSTNEDTEIGYKADTMFMVRLTAPNLKFCQYSSWYQISQPAPDTDFNKVQQLRTDSEPPLCHYRQLRILQLFYTPALILDILDQLEDDHDLSPELSVIEVRDGTSDTSSWTQNHGHAIHDRITARNTNANSSIKLLIKPDRYRWKYSLPEDDEIWGHGRASWD